MDAEGIKGMPEERDMKAAAAKEYLDRIKAITQELRDATAKWQEEADLKGEPVEDQHVALRPAADAFTAVGLLEAQISIMSETGQIRPRPSGFGR